MPSREELIAVAASRAYANACERCDDSDPMDDAALAAVAKAREVDTCETCADRDVCALSDEATRFTDVSADSWGCTAHAPRDETEQQ